ncbi:hypothetical protein [Occultella gossypii]|uniref:Uncharacterized protein n=1 Tax=Occultella gossypii TaxID=2800820 RepID=A0ABS7SC98_9MICO|nr:hypothetical protein [Occultella gossypii]MBZ2197503.1 hypothetical protein [Occultella gossypii]
MSNGACHVLRCPNPAATVINLARPEHFAIDVALCSSHAQEVQAGVPWHYEFEQHVLLMGQDLDVAGRRLAVEYESYSKDVGTAMQGASVLTFRDSAEEPVDLHVTTEAIERFIVSYIDEWPSLDLEAARKRYSKDDPDGTQ